MNKTKVIFLIGVSGVGKTTVGKKLSESLDYPFFDGDDYHSQSNIKKMSSGNPLTDEDRMEWLKKINALAVSHVQNEQSCIIACSALRKTYRDILSSSIELYASWYFLEGSYDLIYKRMEKRTGHFMQSSLLKSQFQTLEIPENALRIDVRWSSNRIVEIIKSNGLKKAEFGVYGLGVMGKNLSRNLAKNGFVLSLYNRHLKGKEEAIAQQVKKTYSELYLAYTSDDLEEFTSTLQTPRKIILMVPANTIDEVIKQLQPFLAEGDILIDGGNSNYQETRRRMHELKSKNIWLIGAGISGGHQGALLGPSIMPSGDKTAYAQVKPFLEPIAAKDKNGSPCCSYIVPEGSGHFIKMVHNGIEYAEMQLLAEVVLLFRNMGFNPDKIATILDSWSRYTTSYLLEITAVILRKKEGKGWLLDHILDKAENKGTGSWTTISAAQLGMPSSMITTSLFSRFISFFIEERRLFSENFTPSQSPSKISLTEGDIANAYRFASIINHYQGFRLIKEASKSYQWKLDLSELARIWTSGCIIRSTFMESLVEIYKTTDDLLLHPHMIKEINALKPYVKKVVTEAIHQEWAIPAINESLVFLTSFSKAKSTANIIQAQRDYFGAHTYQRKDDPSGQYYHTHWQ